MNVIDWLLIVAILLGILGGWRKGFILGIIDLLALAISVLAALFLYPYLAAFIVEYIAEPGAYTLPVSFIATYIIIRITTGLLANRVVREVPADTHDNSLNRFLGIVPGFVNGAIYATIIAVLLLAVPINYGLTAKTRNSILVDRLSVPAEWLEDKLAPVFEEAVDRTMNRMTIKPGSGEFVELPYKVNDTEVRRDLEKEMLSLLNQERIKAGLQLLKADPELAVVARSHSRDMFARGYFSHVTPDGKDPFDRIRAADIPFSFAGENLALAQTLNIAHNGLMNSPGHRANILRPQFGRVGIGIVDGGMYGLMISQEFRN